MWVERKSMPRVAGGSPLLLSGQVQRSRQERVAGRVLVACVLGVVLGPSSRVRKGTAIPDVVTVTDTSGCNVTEAYLQKASRLAIENSLLPNLHLLPSNSNPVGFNYFRDHPMKKVSSQGAIYLEGPDPKIGRFSQ